jgi:hypothetical protein
MALRVLRLNGDAFLINGNRLVFGEDVTTEDTRQPGGWLPVVYLDRNNRPIDLEKLEERALEAAPEVEAEIEAAFEAVEEAQEGQVDAMALDAIAAQYRILAGLVQAFDDALALELQARAMEAKRQADDEYDIEILLMAL